MIETNLLKKIAQKAGNEFQQAAYLDALEEIANSDSTYSSVIKTIYQGLKVVSLDMLYQTNKGKSPDQQMKEPNDTEQKILNYERVIKEIKK
jgi:hypothetical protein